MKTPVFNPQRLDVAAFAKAGAALQGQVPLTDLPRLSDGTCAPDDAPPEWARWQAAGWQKAVLGGSPEVRLRLQTSALVWLTCQRCLQPMRLSLEVDRRFRFMRDEDEAAQLDEESDEEDVLAMSRSLDLITLLEDELIMALPIVPRHETCVGPLQTILPALTGGRDADTAVAYGQGAAAEGTLQATDRPENPFAVLKALKLKPSSS